MKKYIWSAKVLLPLLAIMLVAGAYAGVPAIRLWWQNKAVDTTADIAKETPYSKEEEAILQELIAVCGRMDTIQRYTVEGNMQASDPADSANVMNTHFRYCKNVQEFYYQSGENEMAALKDAYITVNDGVKKVFLSPPKKVVPGFQMSADSILNIWKEDRYIVTRSEAPPLVIINLECENHITCKQYRFTYNKETQLLHKVFLRLTDFNDPLNKDKDKPVQITYTHWAEGEVPVELFRKDHYLSGEAGNYVPGKLYKDYELINNY
jgi:hypothetical protein